MKNIFKLLALVAIISCTACSDIDTENPIINMPSSGNTNNSGDDSSQKVSIVGTWQQTVKFPGELSSHTYTLKYTFNQNGTGTYVFQDPEHSDSTSFRYTFDMALGELHIQTNEMSVCMSAFIVVNDEKEVLHLNACSELENLLDGVFKRVN